MFIYILGIALWVMLAFWPAVIAKRKGYSFILFLVIAWLISFLLALIIAAMLHDKNLSPEDKAADRAAEKALEKEESQ